MLNLNETSVAQHYNPSGFEYESIRLQERSPIEFLMTARYLDRWIPERSTVVDIGVGVGHYAELLAQRVSRNDWTNARGISHVRPFPLHWQEEGVTTC